MDPNELSSVVAELQPLAGARIQRVDVIDQGEVVLELRVPGRTLRLLIATNAGSARAHLVRERPPRRAPAGGLQGALRRHLEGRPLAALTVEGRTLQLDVPGARVIARLGAGTISVAPRSEPLPVPPVVPPPLAFPRSLLAEARLQPVADLARGEALRRQRLSEIAVKIKKLQRLSANLAGDLARLMAHQAARRFGELLKTALDRPKRGDRSVEIFDYATGEHVQVPLDPALDARANLTRLFHRSKKAERGRPIVEARMKDVKEKLQALLLERAELEKASAKDLSAAGAGPPLAVGPVPASVSAGRAGERGRRGQELERCSRSFRSEDGHEIRVGRGAKENDRLTLSFSRGHDLWLHARGVAGAHVVLRLEKGEAPPEQALLDAAHLAAHFSARRGEPGVEVIYTEARYVRKMKGAPAGSVSLAKERTLWLRVEPDRLKRLIPA